MNLNIRINEEVKEAIKKAKELHKHENDSATVRAAIKIYSIDKPQQL